MKRLHFSLSPWRAAVCACVLLFSAVPAIFMNSVFGYLPLLFILFFLLCSFVYSFLLAGHIRCVEHSQEGVCIRGKQLPMSIMIKNSSPLVCPRCRAAFYTTDLFGTVRSIQTQCFTLSAREQREFSFDVMFDHVGRYQVGLNGLWIDGLLGIVSLRRGGFATQSVKVLPQLHSLDVLLEAEMVQSESLRSNKVSSAESIDFAGVREYTFGDPIKLIHWKLSSHAGDYVTKQLENHGNNGLTIIADMCAPAYDNEGLMEVYDCLLECSAALEWDANDRGMDVELLFYDSAGEMRRQSLPSDDFLQLLELLPQIQVRNSRSSVSELLRSEVSNRYANTNVAVCTAEMDDEIAQLITQLAQSGRVPTVFYVCPYAQDKSGRAANKILKSLCGRGISCYRIPSADEIGKAVAYELSEASIYLSS